MLFKQEDILKKLPPTYFMKRISKVHIWKIQSCVRVSKSHIFLKKGAGGDMYALSKGFFTRC